jgi:DNA polymerase (family 10)
MEHPLVDAIGHPTGRLIDRREPYGIDIEQVVEAAIRTGTFLEINANPDRRDLNEWNARLAAERGAMLVIDSDAHGVNTLSNIRYGVATATREWPGLDRLRKRSRR